MSNKQGVVNIHGKEYKTVALRVNEFRELKPDYSLVTELVQFNDQFVIMKAIILDEKERVIATGYAEEFRNASRINKTSALENCETSAIGRALAAFGLAGEEYASADEVANAIKNQNQGTKQDDDKPWYNDSNFEADKQNMIAACMDGMSPTAIVKSLRDEFKVSREMAASIETILNGEMNNG